jgi:hypothetical protein
MDELDLTDEDMRRILLVGRRFLINESTRPDDLKAVLMERLRDGQPALAGKIQRMSNPQMMSLCRTILTQQHSFA